MGYDDHRQIIAAGPTLIVAVCPGPDDHWYRLHAEGACLYWHRPMADGRRLPATVEGLADEIAESGRPTLIYCNAGRNRSTFIAGLVLTRTAGLTGDQAAERIRQARPGALANPLFYEYLRRAPAAA